MKNRNSLGERMKKYEAVSKFQLTPRSPVIVRIDGRAFHTFTKRCNKPFDDLLNKNMLYAASLTAKSMQGFKMAYVQSDEASFLLTDFDNINTQGWFDYSYSKIVSLSASLFTGYFMSTLWYSMHMKELGIPSFDSRAFVVPFEDVSNYFLWRAQDWERNSLTMYCQSFFSHNQLIGKNKEDKHEMLHSIGKNWTKDVSDKFKNGTFLLKMEGDIVEYGNIPPDFRSIDDTFVASFIPDEKETIEERIKREIIEDSDLSANQSIY